MIRSQMMLALTLAAMLMNASFTRAQETSPLLGYVYPAGGRQGSTFQVTLGGRYLDKIKHVHVSGSGIEARFLHEIKPMKLEEVTAVRKRIAELKRLPKEQRTDETRLEMARLERTLAQYLSENVRRRAQPALSEAVALEVAVAADAELGRRELRVESERGLSNPIRFFIGGLQEFREKIPPFDPESQVSSSSYRFPPKMTTDITLPAIVNGQIIPRIPDYVHWQAKRFTPGDADRYRFEAHKGQRLVMVVNARELVPYLADAVPGWFQATLTLYDDNGNELAFHDDYYYHPDPVLLFEVPKDGKYIVEIKDAIHRGRPDFVYRIAIGELPFITSIFPMGGPNRGQLSMDIIGWNLPMEKGTIDMAQRTPGIHPLFLPKDGVVSNTVPFAVDTLPECLQSEPNDSQETAQSIVLPVIINGRVDSPGDWDVYRIEGRKGDQIVAEVIARRLSSPLDSALELTDASGKRLAFNDDHEHKGDALNTHHADSLIHATLPEDGDYFVRLGDAQHDGGLEYAYRLRVSPPRPDFKLRVVPSNVNAVSWKLKPITIYALRKDGFDGEIALSFQGKPEGILMDGGVIPAGEDKIRVTLAIAPWLPSTPVKLVVEGRAAIAGQEIVRTAVPANDMMQAFIYRHLVPAEELTLFLTGTRKPTNRPANSRAFQNMWSIFTKQPIQIPVGGEAKVKAYTPWDGKRGKIQVELSDPPEGITVGEVVCQQRIASFVLRGDSEKVEAGLKGNLIINGYQNKSRTTKDGKKQEYRTFLGPLPAIPFEVVKP